MTQATENKLILHPRCTLLLKRIGWEAMEPKDSSFRFQTHEQYSDVGTRTVRLLMSHCADLPSGTARIREAV